MILTLCLDPILEKEYYMDRLLPRVETQAEKAFYKSSGEGINSSLILNNLNLDVFVTGFLGGLSGQYIFNELKHRGIFNDFIQTKDETKSSISLFESNSFLSRIKEQGPRVTREEIGSFYELYQNIISKYNIVCGLGSLPIGVPKEIYFDLITLANRLGKKFILDGKGQELFYGIEGKPFMVKTDIEGLETLTKLKLDFENEIIKAGYYLIDKGIELVVIDLDNRGSIVLNKERGYRLYADNLDLEDLKKDRGYTVAGFAMGIDKAYDLEVVIRLGQAFRIAYGLADHVDNVDMSDIKKIMGEITISPINY